VDSGQGEGKVNNGTATREDMDIHSMFTLGLVPCQALPILRITFYSHKPQEQRGVNHTHRVSTCI
jgi:hypothetical protein